VETDEVFQRTHGLVLGLLTSGKIAGLRIDHVDGLHDPLAYLRRLRSKAGDAYIVVEKILEPNEDLPDSWPVQGTTGYEFIHHVNGLFCDKKNERAFGRIWSEFIGTRVNFDDLVREKKKVIIAEHMAGDVNNLAQLVKTISSVDRYALDATLYGLRRALAELLAAFPVYRTYIDGESSSQQDRQYIQAAVDKAVAANPGISHELMFLKRFLLMEFPAAMDDERKADWLKVAMRFQQLTGPLMAKGFEDTALYVYNRLISLNEVGCRPDRFGCSVESFHRFNRKRRAMSPHTMNATSTHDTKRGEDVRTRIDVLSEIPEEWERQVRLWSRLNRNQKKRVGAGLIPDKNDEYFLYQTLLGAFPFGDGEYAEFVDRIKQYILKAVREAKVHTKWIEPDAAYEDAYMSFLEAILDPSESNQFLAEFLPFQGRVAHYGVFNSLSQALIKMTSPGVPDFYQGTELWDLNLVDPDNRRPVLFDTRLSQLSEMEEKARRNLRDPLRELLSTREDGRIKLFLMSRTLQARRSRPDLFSKGRYLALKTAGKYRRHIVAFAREHSGNWSLTAAPRFLTRLIGTGDLPLGTEVWHDTHLILPRAAPSEWRNALTDESISVRDSLPIAQALEHFPVGFFVH